MARDTHPATDAELEKSALSGTILASFEFDSGRVNFFAGTGRLRWSSATEGVQWFIGTATLGKVSPVNETITDRAEGTAFELSGIPLEVLEIAGAENIQGRPCRYWFAALNGREIVGEPVMIFRGYMDIMQLEEGGGSSVVRITAESRLRDSRAQRRVYGDADQRAEFGDTDTAFRFLASIPNTNYVWGAEATKVLQSEDE